MKAKYLFYSLALASAFTACTQDEMFDAPALDNNNAAGRPVAGVVTFVNNEVESRYNSESAEFESGDQMGLYLMDEFRGYHQGSIGEMADANLTYWDWQSSWWTMYNMVDYINTNYGYVYNAETGEWINRASQLIEGNYIAMFPQNTRATNRRDLWHPIKSNLDLVDHSSTPRYYVNRENQFFVGYEQIKRNQKAGTETGELTADITMKPILTYGKMYFENQAANNFKIKKVVFKAPGGKTLPNVAYVKPAGIVKTDDHNHIAPWWAWTNRQCTESLKQTLKDECDNVLAWSKYDRSTFTHAGARSMVQYASTSNGQIPYGMTDAEAIPTYEYVFNFPADADILKSNQAPAAERVSGISIALPAFYFDDYDWQDMEVVVYGEMWDPTINYPEGGWRSGIVRKLKNNQNGVFTLDELNLWTKDAPMSIPSVTCRIDDQYFYQSTEIRVSTTKDLYDLIDARLSNASNTQNIFFEIQHYGNGLEITDEVVKLVTDYEKDHNVNVAIAFINRDGVQTPLIFKAKNAINEFIYSGVDVVVEAPQTVTDVIINGINELRNFSTITVAKVNNNTVLDVNNIINEEDAVIEVKDAKVIANIHNEGLVNLNGAVVEGEIVNEAELNTEGATSVTSIMNDNNCINCGKDKAQLTVKSGVLTIASYMDNKDDVLVKAGATLNSKILNYGTIVVEGYVSMKEDSKNSGTINIAEGAEMNVTGENTLVNTGVINVAGHLFEQIANYAEIFVIGNGEVVVNGDLNTVQSLGNVAGIIDITQANDGINAHAAKDMAVQNKDGKNYFRYDVNDEETAEELDAALKARISDYNYAEDGTGARIIVRWTNATTATEFVGETESNIHKLYINKNLDFVYDKDNKITSFTQLEDVCWAYGIYNGTNEYYPAVVIGKNVKVQVASYQTLNFKEGNMYGFQDNVDGLVDVEALTVQVNAGAELKVNNHATVGDDRVVLQGAGKVINAAANFDWENSVISGITTSNKIGW